VLGEQLPELRGQLLGIRHLPSRAGRRGAAWTRPPSRSSPCR
jgi:hypothetical protein